MRIWELNCGVVVAMDHVRKINIITYIPRRLIEITNGNKIEKASRMVKHIVQLKLDRQTMYITQIESNGTDLCDKTMT